MTTSLRKTISLAELKDIFRAFKTEFEKGHEPTQLLSEIHDILKVVI